MSRIQAVRSRIFGLMCLSCLFVTGYARANEIWVAPTLQSDTGGLGVGNGIWPVSAKGVTRLVVAVPDDLQTFQGARIVLIPSAPAGAGVLKVHVCTAENSDMVGASCSGPIDQAFVGVANRLIEVDVSAALAPSVTGPGVQYVAVAAYTTPTFNTDHIVGLRFAYAPTAPAGVATLGANTFTGTQTAPAFVGDGSGLANVSANLLDGLDSTAFASAAHGHDVSQVTNAARLTGGNTLTGLQTLDAGNLDLDPSTGTTGIITKNGTRFLHNFGTNNTFLGAGAGNLTMTGLSNTAVGVSALQSSTTGSANVGMGQGALFNNSGGQTNTAIGNFAMRENTSGGFNTAIGSQSLFGVTTGTDNVGVGVNAGFSSTGGSNNIYLGAQVHGVAGESNTMYLGKVGLQSKTIIAGVRGTAVTGGEMVVIDADGRLGSTAAALTPGANSVGTNEVIDDSLTQNDLAPDSVGPSEVAFNYAGSSSEGGAATNAELLDGIDSSAFALAAHGHDVSQVTNAARLTGGNTFTGLQTFDAGSLDLDSSTAASGNLTKNGAPFLHNFGVDNTFLGLQAGNFGVTGQNNTAIGRLALLSLTTASNNTAVGSNALQSNTTGSGNTAHGSISLFFNTTGQFNTAVGFSSLPNNTTGSNNTAIGVGAMNANTTGTDNTAQGSGALNQNTAGQGNTASGANALAANVGGNSNTAHGAGALFTTTGSRNVAVGANAGSSGGTGSDNIYLGTFVSGVSGESNAMYLGKVGEQTKTVIAGVRGTAVTGGEMVVIDANGRLGSTAVGLTPDVNSVGTNEVIDDSLTAADLAPDSVGASEVAFNYAGSASEGGAASNAELLDGIDSSAFALAVHGHDVTQVTNAAKLASNTFTATQTIDGGNLDLDNSTATTGSITKDGTRFLHNFGLDNTFLGVSAGNVTMTGFRNTASGSVALSNNTTGVGNTANGVNALRDNTSGSRNTASGNSALLRNTTGNDNTASGDSALFNNTTGGGNTAAGGGALHNNATGVANTATGNSALSANTAGIGNTATGFQALGGSTGSDNVAVGRDAGGSSTTGSNNIYLGANILGAAGESNTMYLGKVGTQTKTMIAGVRGTAVTGGDVVVIDANGRLGSTAAALTPGANSVGTNEVIDDSLTAADLAPDSVGASEVAFNYAGSATEGGAASNADLLDGLDSSAFALTAHGHDVSQVTNAARLNGTNSFSGNQTIAAGNVVLDDSTSTTGSIIKSGIRFLHNSGNTGNVFLGMNSGNFTTSGVGANVGLGANSLFQMTTGYHNVGAGSGALLFNTTGFQNTALGGNSLFNNTTGNNNLALGAAAGSNATTGTFNIYLGAFVEGVAGETNTMYLGRVGTQTKTVIAGVRGTAVTGGEMVVIDANGRLGSTAAALTPGANSVGSNEVIDDSLTAADLAPDSVGASEVAFNYAGSSTEGGAATNAELLDGIDSSAFALAAHGHDVSQVTNGARVNGTNTFTATQTIDTGNVDLDHSTATAGSITKNGTRFLHNFGDSNTFLGVSAGNFTTTGANNVGTGFAALIENTTGTNNTASGVDALRQNTTGIHNTASGAFALRQNTTGNFNTAIGQNALFNNITGGTNTAIGDGALYNATGINNTAVGREAGHNSTTGSNNIYLGNPGMAGESGTMYLGGAQSTTFIAGVRGQTTGIANAIPVVIDSNGELGTISSSRRFKEDINDMPASLNDRLLKLRPVTFRYTKAYADGSKPIQYGLVAEEVAEVFPELAVRNADGEVETVHYETLNVLLLKQFQEQQATLARQQSELDQLKQQMRDLIQSQNSGK